MVDLNSLLLPDGQWPQGSRFAVSCNNGLLRGWVKQPSPCCAAASVAGALNALKGVQRGEPGSLDHLDVLQDDVRPIDSASFLLYQRTSMSIGYVLS